ncbi:hypothetical protein PTSG_08490 [Salpingoeca rosetta]|uniref:Uncharacterized protein n=1 Tax=Salpingoeca rosetta (strain ATCC 50818 / BSB-021) TaxID=946362 RepID=F2UJU6_SALR5|nr:uncharacterized protein PTSG_08490 [Salpingoeca rosetta]EGD77395.1 hypothetical protein PTSG_08490 [Salpingoeca rosetta]|eukprot:XP_004990739.1 hypothetical protein PTSG_08490 [Salpingoeca rosetta]
MDQDEDLCAVVQAHALKKPHMLGTNHTNAFIQPAQPTLHKPSMLSLCRADNVYEAAVFKGNDTIYVPLRHMEVLFNASRFDEVTFDEGEAFLGNHAGVFESRQRAFKINFWRFSETSNEMKVVRSFAVLDMVVFHKIKSRLGNM